MRPNFIIKAGGAYSQLVEENWKDPQKRNKIKIYVSVAVLLVVLLGLIATGVARSNEININSVNDPDVFEKMLQAGGNVDDDEELTVNDIDDEDTPELPSGCKSRRGDHPGTASGARIQFIHVPKSGGTSIEKAMASWNHGAVFRELRVNIDGSNENCAASAGNYFLFGGHRGFGFCKDIAKSARGLFTFTAFREPVSRAVSLYDMDKGLRGRFFTRVFGSRPLQEWLKEFNRTEKIEEGEAFLRFMGTQQARFLCGYDCFLPKNKSMNDASYLLARAKQNLHKLDAVGVSERLDELIPQLKLHLRWLPVGFKSWPHNNVRHSAHSSLDEEARAILAEYSKPDAELYKLADELAKQKTKEAVDCLARMKDV